MKILLAEDDPFHARVIGQELKKEFGRKTQIHPVSTEKQFRQEFLGDWDLAVVDEMMPWTSEEDPEPYAEAPEEGPLRAGTRCYKLLRSTEATKDVPVVFLTNLDPDAVPEEAKNAYVRKSIDFKPLIKKIQQVLGEGHKKAVKP